MTELATERKPDFCDIGSASYQNGFDIISL